MGNDHSRGAIGAQSEASERPPDYYELLQVNEESTADEIRVGHYPSGV